jgi:hypothetical protein
LTKESVADPEPPHKPAPLRGSLGDLVTRAQGRPIYCTPSFAVRRALMNVIVGSLRPEFPAAVFVHALTIYRNHNDWRLPMSSQMLSAAKHGRNGLLDSPKSSPTQPARPLNGC